MASFDIRILKHGRERYEIEEVAVCGVTVDAGESEIVFPSEYEGKAVTHIGYEQKFTPGEMRYHDWHHPAQGMDYEPARYDLKAVELNIPATVCRIVLPKEIKSVSYLAFSRVADRSVINIDPENPYLTVDGEGKIHGV